MNTCETLYTLYLWILNLKNLYTYQIKYNLFKYNLV